MNSVGLPGSQLWGKNLRGRNVRLVVHQERGYKTYRAEWLGHGGHFDKVTGKRFKGGEI
jgi:hypothetical protein